MSSTQPLCCLPYKQANQSLADTMLCGAIILLHSSAEEHYYLLSLPILVKGCACLLHCRTSWIVLMWKGARCMRMEMSFVDIHSVHLPHSWQFLAMADLRSTFWIVKMQNIISYRRLVIELAAEPGEFVVERLPQFCLSMWIPHANIDSFYGYIRFKSNLQKRTLFCHISFSCTRTL
jgi:hypothetical protein